MYKYIFPEFGRYNYDHPHDRNRNPEQEMYDQSNRFQQHDYYGNRNQFASARDDPYYYSEAYYNSEAYRRDYYYKYGRLPENEPKTRDPYSRSPYARDLFSMDPYYQNAASSRESLMARERDLLSRDPLIRDRLARLGHNESHHKLHDPYSLILPREAYSSQPSAALSKNPETSNRHDLSQQTANLEKHPVSAEK